VVLKISEKTFGSSSVRSLDGDLFYNGSFALFSPHPVFGDSSDMIYASLGDPYISALQGGRRINVNNFVSAHNVVHRENAPKSRVVLVEDNWVKGRPGGTLYRHVSSPIFGGFTYLFDSRGYMVPSLFADYLTGVWVVDVKYVNGGIEDGAYYAQSQVGLWFRKGKCEVPRWQLELWTARMKWRMRRH
jgi:hypothetical protein